MSQNMNLSMTPYTQAGNFVCSQYDVGRQCQIQLIDENGAYTIPSGATVTVMATKPSGLGFSVACTFSGSTVTFTTTDTMTNEAGRFPAELRITSGSTVLGTTNFYFKVERSPHPNGTTDGDAQEIISEITVLVERAETAAETAAEDAAAAAQETIDELMDYLPQEVADLKEDLNVSVGELKNRLENDIELTVGYLAENIFPLKLTNGGTAIHCANCNAEITGSTFTFTATTNTELYFGNVVTSAGIRYSENLGAKMYVEDSDVVKVSLASYFTKNYVTFFDSNDLSLSYKFFGNNEFLIYPPSNTEYIVLRVGVPQITSGVSYNTKISVTKQLKSVLDLIAATAEKITQYSMFREDLIDALDLVVGGLDSDGNVYTGQKYRASTNPIINFDKPFKVVVPAGKAIGYITYDSAGIKTGWFGWHETAGETFTIPSDTFFRFQVRNHPEDVSVVLTDVNSFVEDFSFYIVSDITTIADRVSALEEKGLPAYYYNNDWLGKKILEVNDACGFLNGVAFPFITDLHFNANALNSKYLLAEVLKSTSCSSVFSGGDYATMYGTQENLDEEYKTLLEYAGYVGHEKWFSMNGNHDFYNAISSSDSTRHSYTWGKTYNGIFRVSERWQEKANVNSGYYCIDNDVQKTRFIVLNSCEPDSASADYTVIGAAKVKSDQLKWMFDRIKELSDYRIIVFSHIPSDPELTSYTSAMLPVQTLLEAFANQTFLQ